MYDEFDLEKMLDEEEGPDMTPTGEGDDEEEDEVPEEGLDEEEL